MGEKTRMVKSCRMFFAALFLFSGLALADGPPPNTAEVLSEANQKEIRAVALKVKEAILDENVDEFLRHVSPSEGLTCTDSNYSYKSIERFLRDKNSHLYISLFDSVRFSRQCGNEYPPEYPAISEKEFFRAANDSVQITKLDNDWAKVTFTSSVKSHYPREWYFHREGGTWKLAGGSVVIGSCSCG